MSQNVEMKEGDLIDGTVVFIGDHEVILELGYKTEGFVPASELSIRRNIHPSEVVHIGERIQTMIVNLYYGEMSDILLSRTRAQAENLWAALTATMESNGSVEGQIVEVVPGGVLVDIGMRAFLPASLLELRHVHDLVPYVGKTITAKIIEMERHKGNVVISRRAHLEEVELSTIENLFASLAVGQVRTGRVSGFFAPEISPIRKVTRTLAQIPYFIKGLKADDGHLKVANDHFNDDLSEKRTYPTIDDARDAAALLSGDDGRDLNAYKCATCEGWHIGHVRFGVFVDLGGVDALLPHEELSWTPVDHPAEVVAVGDEIEVQVIAFDKSRERITVSLKATQGDPWQEYLATHSVGHLVYGRVIRLLPFGAVVQIGAKVAGLLDLSEMSDFPVEAPEQVVTPGEELWLKIVGVDEESRMIELSIRRAAEGGELAPEYVEALSEHSWQSRPPE